MFRDGLEGTLCHGKMNYITAKKEKGVLITGPQG